MQIANTKINRKFFKFDLFLSKNLFYNFVKVNFLVSFSDTDSCSGIIEEQKLEALEIDSKASQKETKRCQHGIATITPDNERFINNYIACMADNHDLEKGYMFRSYCLTVPSNCPTFYIYTKADKFECQEVCWEVKNQYTIICNKSYLYRNLIIASILLLLVVVLVVSWKNKISIQVSCYLFVSIL